jgi:hypothetical protein
MSFAAARARQEHAVPVELRFIDLYMAALGALLFLAMLLAYLLPKVPPPKADESALARSSRQPPKPLSIATREIPSGVIGAPYSAAVAYRGGAGAVEWSLRGAETLPRGIRFDAAAGVFEGSPSAAGVGRVVVRAVDAGGAIVDQPYDLVVTPPPLSATALGRWVVTAVAAISLGLLIFALRSLKQRRETVKSLRRILAGGGTTATASGGKGVEIIIKLPEGLAAYELYYRQQLRKVWWAAAFAAGAVGYAAYVWFAK